MHTRYPKDYRAPLDAGHWAYIETNMWLTVFAAGMGIAIAAVVATMAGDVTLLITLPASMAGIKLAAFAWRKAMGGEAATAGTPAPARPAARS